MSRKKNGKPGYGKILDAWVPPENSGDPKGCIVTSYTFSPELFEEECLKRFLRIGADTQEESLRYLLEREEKLSQNGCAVALIDQHHCQGERNLRWDMIPVRVHGGIMHAKITLLHWQNHIRLIIASANITMEGYRHNREVFGVLDYNLLDSEDNASAEPLSSTLNFLLEILSYASGESPGVKRCNTMVADLKKIIKNFEPVKKQLIQVEAVFSRPKVSSDGEIKGVLGELKELLPAGPPKRADIVSPFFDQSEVASDTNPAFNIWKHMNQRGEAVVTYFVEAEELNDGEKLLVRAPGFIESAKPDGRTSTVKVNLKRILPDELDSARALHLKTIWLENDIYSAYMIGSSNFTSRGLGLSSMPNLEANLVYIFKNDIKTEKSMRASHVEGETIEKTYDFEARKDEEQDGPPEDIALLDAFEQAVYSSDENGKASIEIFLKKKPRAGWTLSNPAESMETLCNEEAWVSQSSPLRFKLAWGTRKPPSGFYVTWSGSPGRAWLPVIIDGQASLPYPNELNDLKLEDLISLLTSARPIAGLLAGLKRKKNGEDRTTVDPHKKVDTSAFLLQRTRRISWALTELRKILEKPVSTIEALDWRLRGPVGAMAIAKAIRREALSGEESAFLLAELALELGRVKPKSEKGYNIDVKKVRAEINALSGEIRALVSLDDLEAIPALKDYVQKAFSEELNGRQL